MSTVGSRSRHGCWTCRLRRKKCDEARPSCSSCSSLDLVCYRDGSKPRWMDSGAQEKAKLEEVKRAVRRSLVQRRSRTNNNNRSTAVSDHEAATVATEENDSIRDLPTPSATVDMDLFEINPLEVVAVRQSEQGVVNELLDWHADLDYDHVVQQHFTGESSTEPLHDNYATFLGDLQANQQLDFLPASSDSLTQEAVVNLQDATLLMCYLDRVFYIQFPCFETFSSSGTRGWLFSHLRKTDWLFNATVALAKVYQRSLHQTSDNLLDFNDADDVGERYATALRGLQSALKESHTWTGSVRQTNTVRALMCISQLIYFEIFEGCSNDWNAHLRSASSLVPLIVGESSNPMALDSIIPKSAAASANLAEDSSITCFLLALFLWFDIMACASTGSDTLLWVDHEALLRDDQIRTSEIMGCPNWVLLQILRISRLHKWRKEMERHDRLSIAELAKKSTEIEQEVNIHIIESPNLQSKNTSGRSFLCGLPSVTSTEVTQIYALASLTYLHVVVSGANPKLPEIIQSVSKTMAALAALTDRRILKLLVWPLCVTGCLVSEEQQNDFRNIMHFTDLGDKAIGTFSQAFKIVKECWRLRKNLSQNCDWMLAMNSLNCHVLLV